MAQWIAFDESSVAALARQGHKQVQLGVGDAVDVALQAGAPAMALLPAGGRVTVITVQPAAAAHSQQKYVATGFLGLIDAPADEDDNPPPQHWWQRLWR